MKVIPWVLSISLISLTESDMMKKIIHALLLIAVAWNTHTTVAMDTQAPNYHVIVIDGPTQEGSPKPVGPLSQHRPDDAYKQSHLSATIIHEPTNPQTQVHYFLDGPNPIASSKLSANSYAMYIKKQIENLLSHNKNDVFVIQASGNSIAPTLKYIAQHAPYAHIKAVVLENTHCADLFPITTIPQGISNTLPIIMFDNHPQQPATTDLYQGVAHQRIINDLQKNHNTHLTNSAHKTWKLIQQLLNNKENPLQPALKPLQPKEAIKEPAIQEHGFRYYFNLARNQDRRYYLNLAFNTTLYGLIAYFIWHNYKGTVPSWGLPSALK
jgi:hypothetical protein